MLNNNIKLLGVFPILNLLFMHYYFYNNHILEWIWMYSEIVNLCGVIFDVSVLLIISLYITGGRFKPSLAITQAITIMWSFVNVMYGKFFFQYMSLTAIGEVHGLGDGLVINSIASAFYWYDSYYLISIILFVIAYKKIKPYRICLNRVCKYIFVPVFSVLMTFLAYSTYHFVHPRYRNNWELYKFRAKEFLFDSVRGGTPNLAHFQTGCIRVAIFELYDMFHVTELNKEQRRQIEEYYGNHSLRTTHNIRNPKIKNVIFVLLESFLSAPIDLNVDGKEITPFLNSLKRDSNVYYNGNMISDIGCGESGDGQFIYMTGILPLKYKMTVGQVNRNTLPAMPKILMKNLGIKNTEIIFPTMPNLWQQSDMNIVYGINHSFSSVDILDKMTKNIGDKEIFDFAAKTLDVSKIPFFSLILSISTHSPYNKPVGEDLGLTDRSIPNEYKNYLCACHFLDSQLRNYISALKSKGISDSSFIVIASDHHAHLDMLKMNGRITRHTPLFIINGGLPTEKMWKGEFHQVDTYTTLLDVLAINESWLGLGYSLMHPLYKTSVNTYASYVSDMIIEGDYFAQ